MTEITKPQVGLLVLDLDNTLWDWVDVWVNSFSALLDGIVAETGLPMDALKAEIASIHQAHGTTEYSLLLDEIPSLRPFLNGQKPSQRFEAALHAQNSIRKHQTQLYPTVLPTLLSVKARGVKIVAYTESLSFWTEWRIKLTGLDGLIDVLYSSPDHDLPSGMSLKSIRTLPKDSYGLKRTEHRHVEKGVSKPNPRILQEIVAEHGVGVRGIAYVGDNLSKDVVMAQSVGVFDVHAAYGEAHKRPEYNLLREVTHWTPEAVARERTTVAGALPVPTFVLKEKFAEILDIFEFGPDLDVNVHTKLWEQAVTVQQHFNDIGWRIRALALTAITFTLGATGFAYVNAGSSSALGPISVAALVPVLGLILWIAFWFMDALWFHRLLQGAVDEGTRLERLLRSVGVRVNLGGSIGKASAIGWAHSTEKLHIFYAWIALALVASSVLLVLAGPRESDPAPAPTVTVINSP